MSLKKLKEILDKVQGWLDEPDALLLSKYASKVQAPSVIVEIGSFKGRSTCVLANAASVPVYAVDPHAVSVGDPYQFGDNDREEFSRNIANFGFSNRVRPVNLKSYAVGAVWESNELPVGFLFVDGAHSYEAVRDDLDIWHYNMSKDSYIAFHDANAPQIKQAINEVAEWLEFVEAANITEVYKVTNNILEGGD